MARTAFACGLMALALTGGAATAGVAQTPSVPVVAVPRAASPPTLADVAADRLPVASRIADFRQRDPGDGAPASRATVAFILSDDHNLYIGFHGQEERSQLRARMARREDIADDDQVAVYLDPFRDHQRAYVFAVSPLGVQLDGIQSEGEDPDYTFDAVWKSEAMLTDDGFAVLMTIPFTSLRFPPSARKTWGLALGRYLPRGGEEVFWPYITRRIEGFTRQMAAIELDGVAAGHHSQIVPYAAFARGRSVGPTDATATEAAHPRAGIDAKVVMRGVVTLDLTVNPDFSHVESDEPQVTSNQRFEVFVPEKRPFFMENADFFATPDTLFFSRRVVDPQVGARLTGQAGAWTFGSIVTDDRAPDADGTDEESTSGRAAIGVLRLQRSLGAQSRVAVFAAGRDGPSGSTSVLAMDTRLKLGTTWVFTGQAARSRSTVDGLRTAGTDIYGDITRVGRAFAYSGNYLDRSPFFDARLGFVERVDIRQTGHTVGYTWYPSNSRLLSLGSGVSGSATWNHAGQRQDWEAEPEFVLSFQGPADLRVSRVEREEVVQGRAFRQHAIDVSASDAHLRWLVLSGQFRRGVGVNYEPAAGLQPFLAESTEASVSATWRPWRRLRLEEVYYFTRLGQPRAAVGAGPQGVEPRVFDDHLTRFKVSFQFTRRMSLRGIVDYHALLPNPVLTDQVRTKGLTGDVLLTYLVDPLTAIYVGYADAYEGAEAGTAGAATGRRRSPAFNSTDRRFFVKLSYGIRF